MYHLSSEWLAWCVSRGLIEYGPVARSPFTVRNGDEEALWTVISSQDEASRPGPFRDKKKHKLPDGWKRAVAQFIQAPEYPEDDEFDFEEEEAQALKYAKRTAARRQAFRETPEPYRPVEHSCVSSDCVMESLRQSRGVFDHSR
jgi:hypothetical protein